MSFLSTRCYKLLKAKPDFKFIDSFFVYFLNKHFSKFCLKSLAYAFLIWQGLSSFAVSEESFDRVKFFESKIRPIFQENCVECHGGDKQKGGLSLHLKTTALVGGDSGSPIKAGDAQNSLMIKAVERRDEDTAMPPKKTLPAEKVALLRTWIDAGAYWPEDKSMARKVPPAKNIAESRSRHWAFQPVIRSEKGGKSIDQILEKYLLQQEMGFSPRADSRTLVRRAYYGLIGLPPTLEQVQAFEKDPSLKTYELLIDKLLAKPEYGEHWGRHWLDVARYADTKGAVPIFVPRRYPFSYTYRDYVIHALNQDLPYHQFIREQLAADLLPGIKSDSKKLAALGYITVGRRSRVKDDVIDERIDAVTRGLMGLTVSCARCHDHKSDPVSIKDYYALYGVFKSIHEPKIGELPVIGQPKDQAERDKFLKESDKLHAKLEDIKLELKEKYETNHRKGLGDYLDYYVKKYSKWKVQGDVPMQGKEVILRRHSINVRKHHLHHLKQDHPVMGAFAKMMTFAKENFQNEVQKFLSTAPDHNGVLNLLRAEFEKKKWKNFYEVTGFYSRLLKETDSFGLKPEVVKQIQDYVHHNWVMIPKDDVRTYIQVGPDLDKYNRVEKEIDNLMATSRGAPHKAMVVKENKNPHNPKVFIRGNASRPGPAVSRRFLELLYPITGGEKFNAQNSGRLDLAEAITHPNNPLTARVMVNRIWAWHFGKPLVKTPSDFGLQTPEPVQRELLDFLAESFIQSGWSIKSMHRLIMNSRAYQQSSAMHQDYYDKDSDNDYIWRFNPQPLQYEQMRDSILTVSKMLYPERGGRPHTIESNHTKRAIYSLINRNEIPEEFNVFGVADPNSTVDQRIDTLVPQQALYFMNNGFVINMAHELLERHHPLNDLDGEAWIRELYKIMFQREVKASELKLMQGFMQTSEIDRPMDAKNDWSYGYANNEDNKPFVLLKAFANNAYRIPEKQRQGSTRNLSIHRVGGDPGGHSFPNIRRWTSPVEGEILVEQELKHMADVGDGVKFLVKLNGQQLLDDHHVYSNDKKVQFRVRVRTGDTLDFITECYKTHHTDHYERRIKISEQIEGGRKWNSETDFEKPQKSKITYDNKLAIVQALFGSNEFNYLD